MSWPAPKITLLVALFVLTSPFARAQSVVAGIDGVEVSVPAGWTAASLASGPSPLLLTNFGAAYDRGGIVPPGGAEIEVVRVSAPREGLGEYVRRELREASIESTTELTVGGGGAVRVAYTDTFGDRLIYANVTFYVLKGNALFKFYLTSRAGNQRWAELVGVFDRLVSQARFR